MPGFLLDLDGTLYVDEVAVPGAVEALRGLERAGIPFRYVTNTTSRPRSALVARLRGLGFPAAPETVFTALRAGAALARSLGCTAVAPFVAPDALEDLSGFELRGGVSGRRGGPVDRHTAVVIGDLGAAWTFDLLQEAFEYLTGGATLIALSRDRCWRSGGRLVLDAGPFVAALEHAARATAHVAGKPNREFYQGAVASLGLSPSEVIMVGDDLHGDVQGAQQAGLQGWLVRTGKFRPEALEQSGVTPDRILDSVARIATGSLPGLPRPD